LMLVNNGLETTPYERRGFVIFKGG
jgi:hypothetical protein